MNMNDNGMMSQDIYWKKFLNDDMEIDFGEIGKYIKKELDKNLSFHKEQELQEPSIEAEKQKGTLKFSMFDIIGCTVIQIPINPHIHLQQIQVLIETNELLIIIESESIHQVIPLRIKASTNQCKAYFHNQILEIRIPHDLKKNHVKVPISPI